MKREITFTDIFICPDYAVNTLINGNVSECIRYLSDILSTDRTTDHLTVNTGFLLVHEELNSIKELVPEKYEYIIKKLSITRK